MQNAPATIGLVQINNAFSQANYLPYSVGLLQAYAQTNCRHPERFTFLLPIYAREPVQAAVPRLLAADLVGFSTYVWNIRLSLAIAAELKRQNPEVMIVFGGPQVPDQPADFMTTHPFIDVCCHGEGEAAFSALLDGFEPGCWGPDSLAEIPSLSYRTPTGLRHNPKAARIKAIDAVPSPFLMGIFEPLMQTYTEQEWLALWETNRGCPFSCTFCDWGSATQAKLHSFSMERLQAEVDWFAEHHIEFIFCCDANFGILKRDLEIVNYVAETRTRTGYPHALSVQNTKNATERAYQVQKALAEAGLNKGVTLSMQSLDPTTLKAIKRDNISTESYSELQRRFTRDRIETYSDMILGLPGETYDSFVDGVARLIENGQHNRIQFNNLSILPNAEMGNPEYQQRYGMRTVEIRLVNFHGSLLPSEDGIWETQDLVVETASMPAEDWVATRAFGWMTALLHFDKVFQIPIVLARELAGVDYRTLLTAFVDVDPQVYPELSRVWRFFEDKARAIQQGDTEYCRSEEWLNIYWPADEYALIEMTRESRLEAFYADAERRLAEVCPGLERQVLAEAVRLNRSLLKLPFQRSDLTLELGSNLWDVYQGAICGRPVQLSKVPTTHEIDRTSKTWESWDDWCREVIWFGNKKGAYLYTNRVSEPQLEGHY